MSGEAEDVQLVAEEAEKAIHEQEERSENTGLAVREEVVEDRVGSLKEKKGDSPAMEGANNEAFQEVCDEDQPPRDVGDVSMQPTEEEPDQARRQSTLSGSVESLLDKSGMMEHADQLESNGYESMQTLSLASKEDLMASGLKRGHASLMVHLTAGRQERLKKEKQEGGGANIQDIIVENGADEAGEMEKKPNGNGYEVIAADTVSTTQVAERGNWGRQMDYILSCVGYAVGLGNIWRFPYLCYRHGGGVFLIPYIMMLFLAGMPLFFLETAFGQYASQGPVTIWRACPLFAGIGWAMVIISAMVVIYYNIIMAWTAFFIFKSFTLELPWSNCDNVWNSDNCGYAVPPNGTMLNGTWLNQTMVEMMNMSMPNRSVTPAEDYWNKIVLDKSEGIEDLGPVRWQMALCLLLSWVVVFLCICRGVKSSGKVVYFTATFPYVILVCLLIRALTLEGASEGIYYYMNADWKLLKNSKVWNDAASQIFYSLGPAWGGVLTFSSYNKFNHNCFRDAIMVPIINCSTSIFAGFVVFATLGFMSVKTGMDIRDVAIQGPGLVFVTYPEAIAQMPLAPLWSFLFFFMLFLVGLDTQFGMTETVISGFIDQFPDHLRKRKTLFALGVCCLFFLLGLPLVTRGGIYVFELINWYSAWISLMIVGMTECIAIAYFYGFRRFIGDIKKMLGYETVFWWWYCICWLFVTPAIILFIIGFGIYEYVPVYYGTYQYPAWSEALGWVMAFIAPTMIPIFMVVNFLMAEGRTIIEKFNNVIKPTKEWDLAHGTGQETNQAQMPLTQYKMATTMNGTKPGQAV